jgi:hypothetical protein
MGYLGGSGTDDCDGITLDRAGDIYLGCHSDSPDFPHLPAKAPPTSNASMDAVVVKIDGRTGNIVWATRTGGSDWDAAGDLEVAKDGSVYVLGQTQSADFPTTPVPSSVSSPGRGAMSSCSSSMPPERSFIPPCSAARRTTNLADSRWRTTARCT